jgi:hypothetical protein
MRYRVTVAFPFLEQVNGPDAGRYPDLLPLTELAASYKMLKETVPELPVVLLLAVVLLRERNTPDNKAPVLLSLVITVTVQGSSYK